jgi:hypothetical protein
MDRLIGMHFTDDQRHIINTLIVRGEIDPDKFRHIARDDDLSRVLLNSLAEYGES